MKQFLVGIALVIGFSAGTRCRGEESAMHASEVPVTTRIAQRTFPSVFQAWNRADNLPNEDELTTAARHDLIFQVAGFFGLKWHHTYEGLARRFTAESIAQGLEKRRKLLELNPNIVLLMEIRYRDAPRDFLPEGDKWWRRDSQGSLVAGWEEGDYLQLDFSNPQFRDHVAQQAEAAMKSGVVDGIMLDWWDDDDDRLALVKAIRARIGEDALILANTNDRKAPRTAPYINGYFMECYRSKTPEDWERIADTLSWAEKNLREPRINCLETWFHNSRNDLDLMRATTTLSLTLSNGYCLFSDPNPLPAPDHLHNWYGFWDTDLGKAISEGKKRPDGSIRREFSNGTAVYNPMGNVPVPVLFDQPRRSAATGMRSKEHTLKPADGDIYLRETPPPATTHDVFASRVSICLNGDWQRHDGGDVSPVPADGWKTVRVPEGPDRVAEGSAWFRLDFEIPAEFTAADKRILVRFVRVRHYARVFLNGRLCGENFGARTPFEIDVTDAAKPGQSSRLDVWVHNASGSYAMRGKSFTDADVEIVKRLSTMELYQKVATIAEDVFLVLRPPLHLSDVLVIPSVRERKLEVRFTARNDTKKSRSVMVRNTVYLDGAEALSLPETSLRLDAGEEKTFLASAPWQDPKLWGLGDYGSPVLYHLETILEDDNAETVDRLVSRFGFREVWTERDRIMMNGKPLRLLAYWQPEGSGRSLWTLRMASVQASGCNTIHNHAEEREPSYYDVADEMGLLVWDANFCGGPLGTTRNMVTGRVFPEVEAELVRQWPLWAKVVGNHPSVVMIMIGCLIHQDSNIAMARAYRTYDPTRLLQANGARADAPLDVAAYTSHFTMFEQDHWGEIKTSYEKWGKNQGRRADGTLVPLVNSECWYHVSRQNEETGKWDIAPDEQVAKATEEAIDWLGEKPLSGLNLYGQQAFRPFGQNDVVPRPTWPSRSGLGQHSDTGRVGGLEWIGFDYVNYWDPSKPPWRTTLTFDAQKRASKRFLGYEVPVAATRRPSVLVKVVRGSEPVPNAYVYAVPVKGTISDTLGMRTDFKGAAWFDLRDPGTWRFLVKEQDAWNQVDVEAPLQPLDTSRGGLGTIIQALLDVSD